MLQKEGKHHSVLVKRLAQEVGCKPEDIVDFELNVCDTQPGVIGGVLSLGSKLVQAFCCTRRHLCALPPSKRPLLHKASPIAISAQRQASGHDIGQAQQRAVGRLMLHPCISRQGTDTHLT